MDVGMPSTMVVAAMKMVAPATMVGGVRCVFLKVGRNVWESMRAWEFMSLRDMISLNLILSVIVWIIIIPLLKRVLRWLLTIRGSYLIFYMRSVISLNHKDASYQIFKGWTERANLTNHRDQNCNFLIPLYTWKNVGFFMFCWKKTIIFDIETKWCHELDWI